jgi:SSS family solute:Na+ symporter
VLIGAARIPEVCRHPYVYSVIIFSVLVAVYVIMGGTLKGRFRRSDAGDVMFIGMGILPSDLFEAWRSSGGSPRPHGDGFDDARSLAAKGLAVGGQTPTVRNCGGKSSRLSYSASAIGALAQPQLAVRFMTVKCDKD